MFCVPPYGATGTDHGLVEQTAQHSLAKEYDLIYILQLRGSGLFRNWPEVAACALELELLGDGRLQDRAHVLRVQARVLRHAVQGRDKQQAVEAAGEDPPDFGTHAL